MCFTYLICYPLSLNLIGWWYKSLYEMFVRRFNTLLLQKWFRWGTLVNGQAVRISKNVNFTY